MVGTTLARIYFLVPCTVLTISVTDTRHWPPRLIAALDAFRGIRAV